MYSENDTLAGGFPHSDIFGSKLVCQLPEAFRRLPRPSSPVIAKASTTCTYSLDPIALNPWSNKKTKAIQSCECLTTSQNCKRCLRYNLNPLLVAYVWQITLAKCNRQTNHFFHIVKEHALDSVSRNQTSATTLTSIF